VDAERALVEEARRRRRSPRLERRELLAKGGPAAAFLTFAVTFAIAAGSDRPLDATALVLIVVFALLSRLDFEVGPGAAVPTQLAFVPMLFVVPLPMLPLAVCAGYVLGASLDAARHELSLPRILGVVGCCWFSLPPALVLWLAGEPRPDWARWPVLVAALLTQCLADLLHTVFHERLAHGLGLRRLVEPLAYTYGFDAILSPVALLAARSGGLSFLALLPLAGVLWLLARERRSRFDALVQATTDPLTGLPNRRRFDAELADVADEAVAIALVDLDHFKSYNDRFGHLAGDELLRRTAAQWSSTVGDGTLLARFGGEEFALVIRTSDLADAGAAVERLRAATPTPVTCSAGLALRLPGEPVPVLVRRADDALYAAKQNGRAQLVVCGAGKPVAA
jgi:diguanylate cyclase (GGDEF)-like protein